MHSMAMAMMSRKGIGYVKSYLTLHPDATAADLSTCQHGHEHCAQFKHGACMKELTELLKGKAVH